MKQIRVCQCNEFFKHSTTIYLQLLSLTIGECHPPTGPTATNMGKVNYNVHKARKVMLGFNLQPHLWILISLASMEGLLALTRVSLNMDTSSTSVQKKKTKLKKKTKINEKGKIQKSTTIYLLAFRKTLAFCLYAENPYIFCYLSH